MSLFAVPKRVYGADHGPFSCAITHACRSRRAWNEAWAGLSDRGSLGGQVVGATAHDGCQSRPRHVRNLTHATDDRGVRGSGLGVVNGGESGGDTGLPCGDGDVPGDVSRVLWRVS